MQCPKCSAELSQTGLERSLAYDDVIYVCARDDSHRFFSRVQAGDLVEDA